MNIQREEKLLFENKTQKHKIKNKTQKQKIINNYNLISKTEMEYKKIIIIKNSSGNQIKKANYKQTEKQFVFVVNFQSQN